MSADTAAEGGQATTLFHDLADYVAIPRVTALDARIWYETVFAFPAEHVLGQPWQRPPLL